MRLIFQYFHKLGSAKHFYRISGFWLKPLMWSTVLLFALGLFGGLCLSPADYQQGDAFRIIYIHVPSAFLSMMIYSLLAVWAFISLVWQIKLMDVFIKVAAPLGAWFTFVALVTGSLWGKPMWGTWWIWEARLTSELLLLFIYLAVMALQSALSGRVQSGRAIAIFVLIGFIDIPVIHYSVTWWNSLHQGATLSKLAVPSISASMFYPLAIMLFAFIGFFVWQLLQRARMEILQQQFKSTWVQQLIEDQQRTCS